MFLESCCMLHFKDEWRTGKRKVKSTIFKFFWTKMSNDMKVSFVGNLQIIYSIQIISCNFEISQLSKTRLRLVYSMCIILIEFQNYACIFLKFTVCFTNITKNTFGLFYFWKSLMFVYIKLRLPILITNVLHHDI